MALSTGAPGITVQQNDVFRVVQPLVAGNNVITDNAGFTSRQIEVRNNVTGAEIAVRVIAESTNSFTIFTPVAVASARISSDW